MSPSRPRGPDSSMFGGPSLQPRHLDRGIVRGSLALSGDVHVGCILFVGSAADGAGSEGSYPPRSCARRKWNYGIVSDAAMQRLAGSLETYAPTNKRGCWGVLYFCWRAGPPAVCPATWQGSEPDRSVFLATGGIQNSEG
ncbi:hypothetical protein MPH_13634 [Macrophomina phaseolina MS6]|uniref:Uncharacterized protein n=1 Tax=Macrophomina phaseolina (strain MS6) TaxID=1126212 RepID=K2RXX4_MACPH|nr:hypothetical protein MPH_13634 [Macrophomina phaseolina MS6]